MDYREEKVLKGTKTAENLLRSFLNETHAAVKYEYYAKQAKKDGYVQIQNIFQETADNEKQHAKEFFRFLTNNGFNDTELAVEVPPIGITLADTLSNLKAAHAGEKAEMSDLYPGFRDVAREEGFEKIATAFQEISEVEENHEKRYAKLIDNIENDRVFKKDEVVRWKCLVCGYIAEGQEAPEECPSCHHPTGHFELFVETY